jgi:hypothetical protein
VIGDEHLRILRCGYDRPQYLPSMYSLIKGDKWYSYTGVEEVHPNRSRNYQVLVMGLG